MSSVIFKEKKSSGVQSGDIGGLSNMGMFRSILKCWITHFLITTTLWIELPCNWTHKLVWFFNDKLSNTVQKSLSRKFKNLFVFKLHSIKKAPNLRSFSIPHLTWILSLWIYDKFRISTWTVTAILTSNHSIWSSWIKFQWKNWTYLDVNSKTLIVFPSLSVPA